MIDDFERHGEAKYVGIEITPEMVEAGIDELFKFDFVPPIRSELRPAIRRVVAEMCRVSNRRSPNSDLRES